MTTQTIEIAEAKRRARAELEAYRERRRLERDAEARARETADEQIAREIRLERAAAAEKAEVDAELARLYARRDADLKAPAKREREAKLQADPRLRIAETPARRAAKLLRKRLGDDFDAFLADLKLTDLKLFRIELARIPADERAEALARQRDELAARLAAEAATLPTPEDDDEAAILARHGFVQ